MLPVSFFSNYQLRPLMVSDTEEYYNLVSNNRRRLEIFFTGTVSRTSSLADTRVFVEEMIAKMEHRTYFPYLVIDLDNKLPVGFVDLKILIGQFQNQNWVAILIQNMPIKVLDMKLFLNFVNFVLIS